MQLSCNRLNFAAVRDTLCKESVEHTDNPSLTIVEKCLTVQELLQRAIQGLPVNVVRFEPVPYASDEVDENFDLDQSVTDDVFCEDDLMNLCTAKKLSYRIQKEMEKRNAKDKAASEKSEVESPPAPPAATEPPAESQ